MAEQVTLKDLEQALESYAALVEMYPENEGYLQRYADMLQALGREATATTALQHLHDVIAKRSPQEAETFANKYPQIGRITLDGGHFNFQSKHAVVGQLIRELLGRLWLRFHRKNMADGAVLYRAGEVADRLSLVLEGAVDLYHVAEDGSRFFLETVRSDDTVGEAVFLDPGRSHMDAFVSGAAVVVEIPRKKLLKILDKHGHLDDLLAEKSAFRHHMCLLSSNEALQALPLQLRQFLVSIMELRTFKAGELVHRSQQAVQGIDVVIAGDACYLAQLKSGRRVVLPALKAADLTGDTTLKGGACTGLAELYAKTDVTIGHLSYNHLLNVSIAFPPLQIKLFQYTERQRLHIMKAFDMLQA